MLLSIDRVLQLLAEGKSIEKIAELANVDSNDVLAIVEEARKIVNQFDKQKSKSKIIIKKKNNINTQIPMEMKETDEELFDGFEVLSTIPTE